MVPPNVAQQIAIDPVKLDFVFSKIKALGFGGGALTQTTGETLVGHEDLFPILRSTENSLNLLEYEALISSHPIVRSALMLGTQRQQACLLVESHQAQQDLVEGGGGGVVSTALDALWPLISHANERCTKQAAMLRSHVLFTRPEKHLPKGFKGTVQRGAATRLYAEEMEALYTKLCCIP